MSCSSGPGHSSYPTGPFPFVRLIYEQLDTALAAQLGEALLCRYLAVPLTAEGGQARFALADPGQQMALAQELRFTFTAVLASAAEIEAALAVVFKRTALSTAEAALYYTLRDLGLVSSEQMQELLLAEQEEGRPPGWALVRQGCLSEEALTEALGLTFSLPHVRLQRWPLNTALFRAVSGLPQVRGRALPLMVVTGTLYLAVTDPSDYVLLHQVERATGFRVAPVIAGVSALEKGTARLEQAIKRDERRRENRLVMKGRVAPRHLELAQEMAWHTGETLAQVLVRTGACPEETIRAISTQQGGLPPADLDLLRDPEPGVLSLLPQVLAERLSAVPYARSDAGIRVAVAKPEQAWVAELVGYLAGSPAVAEMAPADLVLTTIRRGLFRTSLLALQEARRPGTPAAVTGATGSRADFHLLVHRGGYLTREQLITAVTGGEEADIAVEQLRASGLADVDLAEALALWMGLPWVQELRLSPPSSVAALLPYQVAGALEALPLVSRAGQVTVALAQPTLETVRQLQAQLGPATRFVLAPAVDLRKAQARLYTLKPDTVPPMFREFGQYLRDSYGRTAAEVQRFWQRTVLEGRPADLVLVEEGFMPAEAVPHALAQFLRAPLLDLREREERRMVSDGRGVQAVQMRRVEAVDVEVATALPRDRAEARAAIPVRKEGAHVLVAFADPLDLAARTEVGSLLRAPITVAVAARAQILDTLHRLHDRLLLGERLLQAGVITQQQLMAALTWHQRTGVRLGKALLSLGYIHQDDLVEHLAAQYRLPFYKLRNMQLDRQTAFLVPEAVARQEGLLPIAHDAEHVVVATVDPANHTALEMVARRAGRRVEVVITTEDDLDWALDQVYREQYLEQSTAGLLSLFPDESADRLLSKGQKLFLVIAALLTVLLLTQQPASAWSALSGLLGFAAVLYVAAGVSTLWLTTKVLAHAPEVSIAAEDVTALGERELPVYTVLVPLHGAQNIGERLQRGIERLDYPRAKLDVKLCVEADDAATLAAVQALRLADHYDLVVVPAGSPRTKAKVWNYGLTHAKGEFVVIYDVDDSPEPAQLRKAVLAFRRVPREVMALQARLDCANRSQNLLTRWVAAELAVQSELVLPSLTAIQAAAPLAGTAVHFRTADLRRAGAWDPFNLAEDAGLGVRLYKLGGRLGVLPSITYTEAPAGIAAWTQQWSFRVAGALQTWLVQMRHPLRLWRQVGPKAFLSFQTVVGGTWFPSLLTPLLWVLTLLWFLAKPGTEDSRFAGLPYLLGAASFVLGNAAFSYVQAVGCLRRRYYALATIAVLSPIFWGAMSIAAWNGLFQLIIRSLYQKQARPKSSQGGTSWSASAQLCPESPEGDVK